MGQLNTYNPIYSNGKGNRNDMTSSMLNTPPQDKLHKHWHISNTCERSCIMTMMVGNKMSKTEYALKSVTYPAYDTPINCAT